MIFPNGIPQGLFYGTPYEGDISSWSLQSAELPDTDDARNRPPFMTHHHSPLGYWSYLLREDKEGLPVHIMESVLQHQSMCEQFGMSMKETAMSLYAFIQQKPMTEITLENDFFLQPDIMEST